MPIARQAKRIPATCSAIQRKFEAKEGTGNPAQRNRKQGPKKK